MFAGSLVASSAARSPAEKESQAVMMSILIVCGESPKGHETTDPDMVNHQKVMKQHILTNIQFSWRVVLTLVISQLLGLCEERL